MHLLICTSHVLHNLHPVYHAHMAVLLKLQIGRASNATVFLVIINMPGCAELSEDEDQPSAAGSEGKAAYVLLCTDQYIRIYRWARPLQCQQNMLYCCMQFLQYIGSCWKTLNQPMCICAVPVKMYPMS